MLFLLAGLAAGGPNVTARGIRVNTLSGIFTFATAPPGGLLRQEPLIVLGVMPIDQLIPSLAGLSLSTPVDGNSVEILENGAYFDVLLEEIAAARHSVHFETFPWKEGVLGKRLADALCARAGVTVRVLLDANGTNKMGEAIEQQLKDAGRKVTKFHPFDWRHIGVFNERDHRKLVVLDDRSFETHEEITLGFQDAATAERLEQIFEKYAARASEIKLEAWRKRGWKHRLIDNYYYPSAAVSVPE